jgi:hypothetical protein
LHLQPSIPLNSLLHLLDEPCNDEHRTIHTYRVTCCDDEHCYVPPKNNVFLLFGVDS